MKTIVEDTTTHVRLKYDATTRIGTESNKMVKVFLRFIKPVSHYVPSFFLENPLYTPCSSSLLGSSLEITIRSSDFLLSRLTNVKLDADDILISFGVISLYTSIPIDLASKSMNSGGMISDSILP